MHKLRVAIITPGTLPLPNVKGGAIETIIQQLIDYNEKEKKIDLSIYSIFENEANIKSKYIKNSKVIFISDNKVLKLYSYLINKISKTYRGNQYIKKVAKKLKKEKYDLVIVQNRVEYGSFLRKKIKTPIFLHLHNDMVTSENKKDFQSYNKIICVSEFLENKIKTITEHQNVITIHNGIDFNLFTEKKIDKEKKSVILKEYNIKKDEKIFLYVGRITKGKGVAELINSFLKLNNMNCKLIVIGAKNFNGKHTDEYTKEIIRKSRGKNIIFTGYCKYNDLPTYYSIADFMIVPSIATEAAGLVAIEAAAMKLPVIATASGGLPEYVFPFLEEEINTEVNIEENLTKALSQALEIECEKYKFLSDKSYELSRNFSDEIFCNKIIEAIHEVYSYE